MGIWKKMSFFLSSEEAPEPLVSPRGNRLEVSDVEKKLYGNENCFDPQGWVSPLVVKVCKIEIWSHDFIYPLSIFSAIISRENNVCVF